MAFTERRMTLRGSCGPLSRTVVGIEVTRHPVIDSNTICSPKPSISKSVIGRVDGSALQNRTFSFWDLMQFLYGPYKILHNLSLAFFF